MEALQKLINDSEETSLPPLEGSDGNAADYEVEKALYNAPAVSKKPPKKVHSVH